MNETLKDYADRLAKTAQKAHTFAEQIGQHNPQLRALSYLVALIVLTRDKTQKDELSWLIRYPQETMNLSSADMQLLQVAEKELIRKDFSTSK